MEAIVDLRHLQVKLLHDLPVECFVSHCVSVASQTQLLFFFDHFMEIFNVIVDLELLELLFTFFIKILLIVISFC